MHGCFWRSNYSLLVLLIVLGTAVWLLKSDSSAGIRDIDGLISRLHKQENKTRTIHADNPPGGEWFEYTPPMLQLIALGDAARRPLVRRLKEERIQNEVALVLGEIGNEATVPVLIEAFPEFTVPNKPYNYDDPDPALLKVICFTNALQKLTGQSIGQSEWGTEFREGLKQEWRNWWANSQKTFWVKEHTAQPNRTLKSVPQILAQLNAALRDADPRVREAAAKVFRELEHEAAPSVPNLIAAFEDDESLEVRRAAAGVFYWIGPAGSAAIPALIKLICHDPDSEIRFDASLSLARIGKAAIPPLKQLLDSPSAQARRYAIHAIGCMEPKQTWAVPIFLRLSKDTSSDVRGMAYVYMRVISPNDPAVLKALIVGLSDPDSEVRTDCAYSLEDLGPNAAPATEKLLTLVDDPDPEVRIAVWNTFEKLQTLNETHVPKLIAALADDEWEVRSEAAVLLSKIGPPARAAVDALCKSLSDKHGQVRWWSATALGAIGPDAKEAIPLLFHALSDEEDLVRTMAKEALFRIDRKTAIKAWVE
jgi:HEAT repeat protein